MVRASSGQTPRGRSIMTRQSMKRKYRPAFDSLERKQLLSAAVPAYVAVAHVQVTAPAWVQPAQERFRTCGTGKGIIIITS
jgi:hypothetical protein